MTQKTIIAILLKSIFTSMRHSLSITILNLKVFDRTSPQILVEIKTVCFFLQLSVFWTNFFYRNPKSMEVRNWKRSLHKIWTESNKKIWWSQKIQQWHHGSNNGIPCLGALKFCTQINQSDKKRSWKKHRKLLLYL